jgi:magnesium-transporting ATPase (P-type)
MQPTFAILRICRSSVSSQEVALTASRKSNRVESGQLGRSDGQIEPVDSCLGAVPHSLESARTAAFTVLVLTQLFNCFNARSESASAFRAAFSNRWLWAAVALSTALQAAVVHLPFLNLAFGTVPLSAGQWCVCVAMASGVLWFSEGRKLLRRRWARRSLAA